MNGAFQIKRLGKEDVQLFQKLIVLFGEVFETKNSIKPEDNYLSQLLEKPGFIVYTAMLENEVVGGVTAYELISYSAMGAELFIYDIAVKKEFQQAGLGKQLLSTLKEYCEQNGIKEMFVAAHEKDEHAVKFYLSTGGHPENVIHFNYFTGGHSTK